MPSLMMVQSLPLVQKTINMPAKSTTFHTPATNKDEECKEKIPDHENETAELCPVITKEQIEAELNSVAVEWKPLRNCHECPCGSPLEGTVNKKTHCRKCGNIFCTRCVRTKLELPGHMSKKSVPVCNACHKFLQGDMRASQSSQQAEATL